MVKLLNQLGILELLPKSQKLGYVGLDGQKYPLPEDAELLDRIKGYLQKSASQELRELMASNPKIFNFYIVPSLLPFSVLLKAGLNLVEKEKEQMNEEYLKVIKWLK